MFYVGSHRIDPAVVLAPMEGITDRAFRALIRRIGGVGLTVTEFVSSEGLTRDVQSAWEMAELDPDEHPVSIQIYGRDPQRMADAARHCEALGADIVDLNLGCPSKRVTSGCSGSALMREPALASEIFAAVRGAIQVPMTVKMRLGWDDHSLNAADIASRAACAGAAMITVHARTRQDAYKRPARWELVRSVREAVSLPLLVNGDIVDAESARRALQASGADGVMLGRALRADPWAIRRTSAGLRGEAFEEPSLEERRGMLRSYVDYLQREGDFDRRTTNRLRGVLHAFTKGMRYAAALREELHHMKDFEGTMALIDRFFDGAAEGSGAAEEGAVGGGGSAWAAADPCISGGAA